MDTSTDTPAEPPPPNNGTILHDSKGWDGKLRVNRKAVITNAEILSDPEYSDEDAPPVEQIVADEGKLVFVYSAFLLTGLVPDLLEDYEPDSDVCLCCYFILSLSLLTYYCHLGHRSRSLPYLLDPGLTS